MVSQTAKEESQEEKRFDWGWREGVLVCSCYRDGI